MKAAMQAQQSVRSAEGLAVKREAFAPGLGLAALRILRGWSLHEAARRAEIDPSLLFRYEKGIYKPKWPKAVRLARLYGISVSRLYQLIEAAERERTRGEPRDLPGGSDGGV